MGFRPDWRLVLSVLVIAVVALACADGIYIHDIPDRSVIAEFHPDRDIVFLNKCELFDQTGDAPPRPLNCFKACRFGEGGRCYFLWPSSEDESRRWGNLHIQSHYAKYVCDQYKEPVTNGGLITLGHCTRMTE